jgi:ligand-binding sensor domain-containing protein
LAAATATAEARVGSDGQNTDSIPLALPTEEAAAVAPSGTITTVAIVGLPVPTPTPALPLLAGEWTAFTDPNEMNALVAISNTLWIATDGGALAWTKGSTTPVLYTAENGLHGNQLTSVVNCALPGFGVVFGSPAGLQIGDPRTGRWRPLNSASGSSDGAGNGTGMRYDDVATLYCDVENGFLIVGYAEHGIDIYDAEREEWRHLDRNSGLAANDVNALAVVGDRDQIWVASDQGITVSAGSDSAFYDAANSELLTDRVTALAAAPDGTVWLGGDEALYRVDGEAWTVYTAESVDGDFPSGTIAGLALAEDGTLWVGSAAAAICRFDPAGNSGAGRCTEFYQPDATDGMAPAPLTSLAVDAAGAVYYTTKGSGYAVRDARVANGAWRTFAVRNPALQGNSVRALSGDAAGNLWAATNAGVQRLEASSAPELFGPDVVGIAAEDVQVLAASPDGQMWVGGRTEAGAGTRAGAAVSSYDGRNWQLLTAEDGLVGTTVQAIAPDAEGRIWVGSDAGLSVWNDDSFFVINRQQGLPSDDIRALAADAGGVWIGTAGGGLYRFADSQLQLLNQQNVGLPSDTITQLAIGQDGVLWIGSDQGLAQLADGELTPVEELGERAIISLAVTGDGYVWAVARDSLEQNTGDDVLFFSNTAQGEDQWTELTLADPLPSQHLAALLAGDASVWIGGDPGGIMQFVRDGE